MSITSWRFPTNIRFGVGARAALAEFAQSHRVTRPLVVCDGGLKSTEAFELFERTASTVWPNGFDVYDKVKPNPHEAQIDGAHDAYASHSCNAVIGIGGGSAIDGAKAVLVRIAQPDGALDTIDATSLPQHIAPFCALPTTAGTGSEVGQSTVVTSATHGRKMVFGAPALLPHLAILDPELTRKLPAGLTAATGMDAFTHALESFVCPMFHPMCDGIALEAIYRIDKHLVTAVKKPDDLEARGEMLVASAMGAVSFQKDLGAAHSLAHPLSTLFNAHHGRANAVVLPAVVRFNAKGKHGIYDRVAAALNLDTASSGDSGQAVATYIERLNKTIGITERISDFGVTASDLDRLAELAFLDPCHATNPVACSQDDLKALYQASC